MKQSPKVHEINIVEERGTFSNFFKRITGEHEHYDFHDIQMLRQLLSNEKAKIMHTIKAKKPSSLYGLAKLLNRDFKSLKEDISLLQKFGFIKLIQEKSGNRKRLKPIIVADILQINLKF